MHFYRGKFCSLLLSIFLGHALLFGSGFSKGSFASDARYQKRIGGSESYSDSDSDEDGDAEISLFGGKSDDPPFLNKVKTSTQQDALDFRLYMTLDPSPNDYKPVSTVRLLAASDLIRDGANVDRLYNWPGSFLIRAVQRNDRLQLGLLLEMKASVNIVDTLGMTPLGTAVQWDNLNLATDLVVAKADVEQLAQLKSPLSTAISNSNPLMVSMLLDMGASVDENDLRRMVKDEAIAPAINLIRQKRENLRNCFVQARVINVDPLIQIVLSYLYPQNLNISSVRPKNKKRKRSPLQNSPS